MAKKAMALLLCLSLVFGVVGCSTSSREEDVEYAPYSEVWRASDESVVHGTGDLAVDDGWGAVLDTESGALCAVETSQDLHPTAYTAAARLLVSEKKSDKTTVAVLRVLDQNGVELGRETVRLCDFDAKLIYQDFTFTFEVKERTPATFEIYWPGTSYVRVIEFGIMSKTLAALPDFTVVGKEILGVDIEEESEITYDENTLYYFDLLSYMQEMRDTEAQYDIANLICTLQGLVNRDAQRLFVRFTARNSFSADTDSYWLNYLTAEGQFLADKTVVTVKSPMTLLEIFKDYYAGFAAWDRTVPATVNAVATACGVENLLPVRYSTVANSLYSYISTADAFVGKEIKVNLGGKFTGEGKIYETELDSTGSRKNDVYLWAKAKYLDAGLVNSHMMAYHVDAYASDTVFASYGDLQNMFLSNRDYYIANKCFFFDLSPMYEIPDDDPDQADLDLTETGGITIDQTTFDAIMIAQSTLAENKDATKPIDVGGFTPWHLKYTRYTNPSASGEVDCEWETVYRFSIYNAYINADAYGYTAMANASIYMGYPMQETYTQTASKEIKGTLPTSSEQGANYIMFFMGDFDSSAWLNTAMISMWNDSKRGSIPLCWTFALDLHKRAGHVVDMMYATATENDYFVAGDNGAGYLNPEAYATAASQDVYGDLDSWANYNKTLFERFDIDYQGFLVTRKSASEDIIKCYSKFCDGLASNWSYTGAAQEGITVVQSRDYTSVGDLVKAFTPKKVGDSSTFMQIRFILRSPTELYSVWEQLSSERYAEYNFKLVDPYTFYGLCEQQNRQA